MDKDLDYNSEPVYYCKHCLSLRIVGLEGMEFCDSCGSSLVDLCSIEEWELMYKEKYGYKYLNNNIKNKQYGRRE